MVTPLANVRSILLARARARPRMRLAFGALAFAGLLFLLWLRFHQPPNTVDDAYITFRYARNIANGVGFVYNAGERVLGTTTPAYALLLAALSRLSGFYDYPRLALLVNALLDAVTFCLVARFATRLTAAQVGQRWIGLGVALLFAIDGRTLDFSTGGMETSFNLMATMLTLALLFENRTRWAALAAGLAVLVRPDGLTLAAAFFAALALPVLLQPRRWPWREMGLFAAVVAPWLIFATLYFGQPIPQSVLAKAVVYRLEPLAAFRAFLVQLRTVFPFSLPPLHDPEPLWRQLLQAALPAGLCLLGLIALQRRNARAWATGLYLVLFIAFFSAGNPLWLGWYEIPLMPLYWTLILAATLWIEESLSRIAYRLSRKDSEYPIRNMVVLSALLLMALPHLSRLNLLPWETARRPAFSLNPTFNKEREAEYVLFARMLEPAGRSARQVAIPEIGAFGYAYSGSLFDTTGLISPRVAEYFPIPADTPIEIYAVPRQMIFDLRPDIFVTFDSFIQATLSPDDPEFLELYTPSLGLASRAAFGVQRLVAYRRADLPLEAAMPPEAQPVGASFGPDLVWLEGYTTRFWADAENNFLEVTLFWRNGDARLDRDLLVRVNLLSASGELVYQVLDQPGEKMFPTPSWAPGMWLVDRYQLKRPTPEAGPYTAAITLFDSAAEGALPTRAASGGPLPDDTFVIPTIPVPSVP